MTEMKQGTTPQGLFYKEQGQGQPIVLLHGFCGSSDYWTSVVPELARQYRVITPDLRGHGQSQIINPSFRIEDMAQDVVQLMDELQIERAIVFGHSLGGYITLALAEQAAERLQGFSLVHSTANPDAEAAKENRLKAVKTIQEEGIVPFVDGLIPKLFAPDHVQSMPELVEHSKQIGYQTLPEGAMGASLAMRERPDRNHVLASTPLPVLLVAGEADQIVPPEKSFTVTGSHIQQAVISAAGHMSMMESPDALIEVIHHFVQGINKTVS
ncbi:alpha/beta hydrolase [Paenibacillus selenitireducens]|uniref:Alpha/beta hydrolase n=1 Tax=Paenibacillus selenitireducens TaxID=1324314 RepID=A0A1T2X3M6_9BACL|nr:alpha/beta hydrolase [Paenibacillus selenitireducens]OPA74316.1 alpha/beta hydrolase [Paenibacillus selenitireducens]